MPQVDERKTDDDESATPDGIGIIAAREMLGELVLRAGYGNERVILTRKGRPTAALIGMKDLERLQALDLAAEPVA